MNVEIILSMVKPYVKDGAITYDEFDKIFSILSRKEQYAVSEVLFKNGVNLIDERVEEEETLDVTIDIDTIDGFDDDDFEILYDEALFKDKRSIERADEPLVINRNIRQSNEILCALIQEGNRQAIQDLCVKNQRLVDKYVNAYLKRYANRLEFEDLEQVGYIGLIKAAQRFDLRQGTSFSTYAVYWIKQCIAREIMDHGYAIRIPVHMMERIAKVVAANNRLELLNLPLEERLSEIAYELNCTEDEVRECFVLKQNYLGYTSLDAPVGDDEDAALGDFIPYDEAATVEDVVFDKELRKELERVLETLPQKEQEVLKLRFGWEDGRTRTLEEVGIIYGVTRERIRQIESKAIRKLRHPTRAKKLKDYWVK
jgi:RNA polymerase primary sigma factor